MMFQCGEQNGESALFTGTLTVCLLTDDSVFLVGKLQRALAFAAAWQAPSGRHVCQMCHTWRAFHFIWERCLLMCSGLILMTITMMRCESQISAP
jgi:hypothetical protein